MIVVFSDHTFLLLGMYVHHYIFLSSISFLINSFRTNRQYFTIFFIISIYIEKMKLKTVTSHLYLFVPEVCPLIEFVYAQYLANKQT